MKIHIKKDITKMDDIDILKEALKEMQEKLKAKGENLKFDISKIRK